MPVFLRRHQINAAAWDACVLASEAPLVYAMSWYLDVVAPNWCAIVEKTEDGSYRCVMPLPIKWRLGIGFVYQPPFTQQLGVFGDAGSACSLKNMLQALPANIKHFYQQLHNSSRAATEIPEGFEAGERLTHYLWLSLPYAELRKNYKGNLRRKIQKPAPEDFRITEASDVLPTVQLFRQVRGEQVRSLKNSHYAKLVQLCQVLQQRGCLRILELREKEELVSGSVFVSFGNRIIYLFAANSARARDTAGNARLLDFLIQERAGQELLLDFEGGNIPGIGHFFRSFGAVPAPFVSLKMNRLPWPINNVIK